MTKHKFLLCIDNKDYEASLEVRKLYENIPDKEAERHNQVRLIDESGEDYLYPAKLFAPVRLLAQTKNKILERAWSHVGKSRSSSPSLTQSLKLETGNS